MAYQNVGTPRFFIDYFQFAMATATGSPYNDAPFGLNASKQYSFGTGTPYHTEEGVPYYKTFKAFDFTGGIPKLNYVAILGHNLGAFGTGGFHMRLDSVSDGVTDDYVERPSDYEIVNADFSDNFNAGYSGFSIIKITEPSTPENANRITFRIQGSPEADNIKISAFSTGNIYDMPHSPDLKLTMTREMDGVKRIRTKGGADLVNHKYTKPSPWGDAGAWELYTGTPPNHKLSRSGRRVWDLSFSYLQDSDVFAPTEMLYPVILDTSGTNAFDGTNWAHWGGGQGYAEGDYWFENMRFLAHDDFYTQVIHKTNGGQLPFIFQPDKDNNNPDQFAICKLDMKSFKFSQVANGVYNIKLKIREVW